MSMTDEQMRIAIAEACDLFKFKPLRYATRKGKLLEPGEKGVRLMYCSGGTNGWEDWEDIPNYPEDLNACAEFEATLTDDELWEYSKLLMDYRQAANGFPLASRSEVLKLQKATARQRCIAFIKTLNLEPV